MQMSSFLIIVGSLAFHLFGLTTTNLQCWMPPNQAIALDEPLEVIFRLRFRPFDVDNLRKCSKEAFNYYFLQVCIHKGTFL